MLSAYGVRTGRFGAGLSPSAPAGRCPTARPAVQTNQDTQVSVKSSDVIHLGNLCLDVVLEVDHLPPSDMEERAQLLASLSAHPPPRIQWKVGGGTNFMITASRLGLNVASCGHVAQDDFGHHLMDILMEEGINQHVNLTDSFSKDDAILAKTLVCFVLVDRVSREHTFCSRYDFGPWPLLSNFTPSNVSDDVFHHFADTAAVMMNGFVFDELSPEVVSVVAQHAHDSGAALFFDPGPRCSTLVTGSRREAMEDVLSVVSVILVTAEELQTLTGVQGITEGCNCLFQAHAHILQWVVVKAPTPILRSLSRQASRRIDIDRQGCMLAQQGESGVVFIHQDGHAVDIADSVGCGDSFAAAVRLLTIALLAPKHQIVMGYTRGWKPSVALALANAVGACTATKEGAGQNVASREHVEALLENCCQSPVETFAQACGEALHELQSQASMKYEELHSSK